MIPVCTIAPALAGLPGGVEIGQYGPGRYGPGRYGPGRYGPEVG